MNVLFSDGKGTFEDQYRAHMKLAALSARGDLVHVFEVMAMNAFSATRPIGLREALATIGMLKDTMTYGKGAAMNRRGEIWEYLTAAESVLKAARKALQVTTIETGKGAW